MGTGCAALLRRAHARAPSAQANTCLAHARPAIPGRPQPTVTKRGDCSPDAAVGACCEDHNKECAHWAASGECEKNPGYMVGNDSDGVCLRSCHKCDDLPIAGWSSD